MPPKANDHLDTPRQLPGLHSVRQRTLAPTVWFWIRKDTTFYGLVHCAAHCGHRWNKLLSVARDTFWFKRYSHASAGGRHVSEENDRYVEPRLDERLWIGIGTFRVSRFEPQKPVTVDTVDRVLINNGKTPALHVIEWMKYKYSTVSDLGPLPIDLLPWLGRQSALYLPQGRGS
jgi:hypothetical protein